MVLLFHLKTVEVFSNSHLDGIHERLWWHFLHWDLVKIFTFLTTIEQKAHGMNEPSASFPKSVEPYQLFQLGFSFILNP